MLMPLDENKFDVIVVGSGTGGAALVKELVEKDSQLNVLVLEQGANTPLKETLFTLASIVNEVTVGDKLKSMRGIAAGGSTALYAAIAEEPPLNDFLSLGIDLAEDLASVKRELPLSVLADESLGPQALKLRESALQLGLPWRKSTMLIDPVTSPRGYSYDSKWKAKSYVEQAVAKGVKLITRAKVTKVLIENNQAVGVEYKSGSKVHRALAAKVVIAAGVLATPGILLNSGVHSIGNRGFYCNPGFLLFGSIAGLQAKDTYVGCMSAELEDNIVVGDANLPRTFYQVIMLTLLKFSKIFAFSNSIAVGVMIKDGLGGELRRDGSYFKKLTDHEHLKLKKGEEIARKILLNAGAKDIFRSGIDAGNVGGIMRIDEHLDSSLQTQVKNLYVCDGSVIPENIRIYPTLTLVCLGKYLARHLLSS